MESDRQTVDSGSVDQSAIDLSTVDLTAIDLNDGRNFVDHVPHEWFRQLRREAPVFWHPSRGHPGTGSGASPATTTASPSTATRSISPRTAAAPSSTTWTRPASSSSG